MKKGFCKNKIYPYKFTWTEPGRDQLTHSRSLVEESLNTLLAEVNARINSRPLLVKTINDRNSEVALSPNHLLIMNPKRKHHQVYLRHLITTFENPGDKFSTSPKNFCIESRKNFWKSYKRGNSDWFLEKPLVIEIL